MSAMGPDGARQSSEAVGNMRCDEILMERPEGRDIRECEACMCGPTLDPESGGGQGRHGPTQGWAGAANLQLTQPVQRAWARWDWPRWQRAPARRQRQRESGSGCAGCGG